jgi:tryptophan-rich sensory protein
MIGLAGWIAAVFVAAALGAMATANAPRFYAELTVPAWAPPAALFGPVWTVLYVLMAVGAWLVWRCRGWDGARWALTLFLSQLALNALWSWLFFAWRRGGLALAELIVLWALIVATMVAFWRIRPAAGALLLPYVAWVAFAGALNYTLWRTNPLLLE